MVKFSLSALAAPARVDTTTDDASRVRRRFSLSVAKTMPLPPISPPKIEPLSSPDDLMTNATSSRRTSMSSMSALFSTGEMSFPPSTTSVGDALSVNDLGQVEWNSPYAAPKTPITPHRQPASLETAPWLIYEHPPPSVHSSGRSVASSDSGNKPDGMRMVGRGGRGSKPRKPKSHASNQSISLSAPPATLSPEERDIPVPATPEGRVRMVGRGGSGSKLRTVASPKNSQSASSILSSPSSTGSFDSSSLPPSRKNSVPSLPSIPEPTQAPPVPPVTKNKVRVGGGRGGAGSKPRTVKPKPVVDDAAPSVSPSSGTPQISLKWLGKTKDSKTTASPVKTNVITPFLQAKAAAVAAGAYARPRPPAQYSNSAQSPEHSVYSTPSFQGTDDESVTSELGDANSIAPSVRSAESDSISFALPAPTAYGASRALHVRPLPPPPSSLYRMPDSNPTPGGSHSGTSARADNNAIASSSRLRTAPMPQLPDQESNYSRPLPPPRNTSKLARTLGERPPPPQFMSGMGIRQPSLPSRQPRQGPAFMPSYNNSPLDLTAASEHEHDNEEEREASYRAHVDNRYSMASSASTIMFSEPAPQGSHPPSQAKWDGELESGMRTPRPGSPFVDTFERPFFHHIDDPDDEDPKRGNTWTGQWNRGNIRDVVRELRDLRV